MNCPKCGNPACQFETYDSRQTGVGHVERRRRGSVCGFQAKSQEYVEGFDPPRISKVQILKVQTHLSQLQDLFGSLK